MSRRFRIILLVILLIIITGFIPFLYVVLPGRIKSGNTKFLQDSVIMLGARALESNDVPVGAVLLYNNEIIGSGFNTVYKNKNIAGHAEINAVNNFIERNGFDALCKLNHDSLSILSSFEPCLMCRGALMEYGIKNIIFIKGKSFSDYINNALKQFRYHLLKRHMDGSTRQDSLFRKHPDFKE